MKPSPDNVKPDRKKALRDLVDLLLPDGLMIVLAVIMAPVVLAPIFVDLPQSVNASLGFADTVILAVFITEYVLKTILARNIVKHILDPWHLLDLFVVLLPLVSLLPFVAAQFGRTSPTLRLLRIARILAVGSRAADRRVKMAAPVARASEEVRHPIEIRVMDGNLDNVRQHVVFDQIEGFLTSPNESWVDISWVSSKDLDGLSHVLRIPRMLLEGELVDESYPRIDYFEHNSMIFGRIAKMRTLPRRFVRFTVARHGLLVICQGENIVTLCKTSTGIFDQLLDRAKKVHDSGEPVAVSILYAIIQYIIDGDKQIVAAVEQELMDLEAIPAAQRPSNFLELTFYLRKEVNQLVPSLLHLKEIISVITAKRVPLKGFDEKSTDLFDILSDEASYLHETASNARDDLQSLVDLYINTTSYQMNKVMRVIAVMTALAIIPAIILGALGTNLIGNPWDLQLWQVLTGTGVVMLAMGWVFYRLGWFKG